MEGAVGQSGTDRPELREFLAQEEGKWQGVDLTLRLQYRVSHILSEAATLKEAGQRILEGICDSLGWEVGALWEADRQAIELRCVEFWHHPSLDVTAFEQTSRRMTLGPGIGLPGRVWHSGEPATIPETPNNKNFPRGASAASAGLLGAFAFPVQTGGETLGVMEFFSRQAQTLDRHLLTLMAVLGNQIGQFMARRSGEESLRESEARYRLVVESAAEAIFTIDRESTIIFANSAAEKIFGYRPEELVGRPLTILMPERLRAVHRTGLQRYLQTGQKHIPWEGVELPGLHKSGREITLEVSFGEHNSGSQHQFTGVIRDITERKNVEDIRAWLAAIVESSDDAIIGKTLDGTITSWNKGARLLFGYGASEVIGRSIAVLLPPDRAAELDGILDRLRQGESIDHFVTSRMTKDGRRLDMSLTISPIRDQTGKICGASTIARDVTAQLQSQEALEDSERRYRLLFESNPQVMWVYDATTLQFLAVNNAAVKRYGYTRDEFLAMTLRDIRPPEDVPRFLEATAQTASDLHTGGPWRHKKKDGSIITVEITQQPILFGDRTACFAMANDITERKLLEEQLRQAQRLESIGRLAGGVAHDFNNMLTVINGYAEMLLSDMPADEPKRAVLGQIRSAGESAAGLTQQLLAFSRQQVIQPSVMNVNQIVTEASKFLRRLIGEDIELVTRLAGDLGYVLADPGQIQQIVMNLVVNSRDAMPQGGTLVIETDNVVFDETYTRAHASVQPGPHVMLAVTDNGVGMTPEIRDRIFEPFFTTKEFGKGTGLGLATVYGTVKQSGGWIWVYSEPGQGTTFKVYFPRTDQPASPAKILPLVDLRGDETILVVEDEAEVRKLAQVALAKYGYHVHGVSNGQEALAFCRDFSGTIHLILTDVVMADMNGRELSSQIAVLRADVHFLFMSGYTANVIVHHGVLDPDVAYLQKPFTPDTLAAKVREVLGLLEISRTILIIDREATVRRLLGAMLMSAGYAVVESANPREALQQSAQANPVDIILVDLADPEPENLDPLHAFRRQHPHAKIIAMSGGCGSDLSAIAAELGVIATLIKPISREELLRAIQTALQV